MQKIKALISSPSFKSLLIQLSGFGLSFAISLVLTNIYDAKIYGDYVLVFSTLDMFAIFSLVGYNQLFSIQVPKMKTDEEKFGIYKIATKKSLIHCLLISACILLFGIFYPFQENTLRYFVFSSAIFLPFIALTIVNTNFLFSLKETLLTQFNDKIIRFVLFIGLILLGSHFTNSIGIIIAAFAVSTLVTYGISYLLRKRRIDFVKSPIPTPSKFNKTIYLLLTINTINLLFSKSDALQMAYYLGADYAGVNNVYMKMSQILHLVMSSSLLIFSPKISKIIAQERFDLVRKELNKVFRFAIPFSLALLVLVLTLSPLFLSLYKSSIYQAHNYSLTLYCVSAVFGILTGPAALILMLSNKLSHLIIGYSIELLLNLFLNAILIPRYSIEGAAYATLISELAVNLYFTYICYRHFKLNTLFFGK